MRVHSIKSCASVKHCSSGIDTVNDTFQHTCSKIVLSSATKCIDNFGSNDTLSDLNITISHWPTSSTRYELNHTPLDI